MCSTSNRTQEATVTEIHAEEKGSSIYSIVINCVEPSGRFPHQTQRTEKRRQRREERRKREGSGRNCASERTDSTAGWIILRSRYQTVSFSYCEPILSSSNVSPLRWSHYGRLSLISCHFGLTNISEGEIPDQSTGPVVEPTALSAVIRVNSQRFPHLFPHLSLKVAYDVCWHISRRREFRAQVFINKDLPQGCNPFLNDVTFEAFLLPGCRDPIKNTACFHFFDASLVCLSVEY